MKTFFVVGIVLNVVLTGLALYWLWRQRMPKKRKHEAEREQHERQGTVELRSDHHRHQRCQLNQPPHSTSRLATTTVK